MGLLDRLKQADGESSTPTPREARVKPLGGDALAAVLQRVHELEKPAPAAVGPAAPAPELVQEPGREGRIILVFSGKGGVGKSILAVNLAAALAKSSDGRTVLVDLDLQFGDLGVLLGLDSGRNVHQVVEAYPNVDAQFIKALMPKAPGGFTVLLGPQSPELADLVTADITRTILTTLQASYDQVIVDTSSHLGEVTLEALERADLVVFLVDLSLPAVKDAKLALRVFHHLGIANDKVKLVLNRADSNLGIIAAQIESSLDLKIAARLPTDVKTVSKSEKDAEPFVSLLPNAEISQRVREFALTLLPLHADGGSGSGHTDRQAGFSGGTAAQVRDLK